MTQEGVRPRALVVGAGPTGTTTALALARHAPDVEVTLIDRAVFPRDKACGDGLGPGARAVLAELGLTHLLEDFSQPTSVALTGPGDVEARAQGPIINGKDLSGYVAPRLDFDARLVEECRRIGIDFHEDAKLVELGDPREGRRISAVWQEGSTKVEELYDLVIGADGAYSSTRRLVGLPSADKAHTHIAMRSYTSVHHEHQDVADTLRLDFIEAVLPAYGWVFPLPDGRANVGVGLPISKLHDAEQSLREILEAYYRDLERRGFKLGEPEDAKAHQLPHAAAHLPMTAGRVVLLGDAAGTINPFSGEGIFYGMAAGVQLSKQIAAAGGDSWETFDWPAALETFEHAYKRRFRRHFRNAYFAHEALRSKTWAKIVTRAASKNDDIMAAGAFIMFDEGSIRVRDVVKAALSGL